MTRVFDRSSNFSPCPLTISNYVMFKTNFIDESQSDAEDFSASILFIIAFYTLD